MNLLRPAVATLTVLGALFTASPASAARSFEQAGSIACGNARVAVAPVRVWASANRPETVVWGIQLDRWNGRTWVKYSTNTYIARFDYYGRNTAGWSVQNTRTGGRFINSRMQVPDSHRGYYRAGSVIAAPGVSSAVYIGGLNNYCYVP